MSGEAAAQALLRRLEGVGPIDAPVALVVAHPDDESVAMAGTLARVLRLTLIHVTDGAPLQPERWAGLASREALAARRRAELDDALAAACVHPEQRLAYGLVDGAALDALGALADRLTHDLRGAAAVITHPYEGGHVDHDACALAVQAACARLHRAGEAAPGRLEAAGYHARRGRVRAGAFWPDPARREVRLVLGEAAARRREAAFACHASQADNLRFFRKDVESFRIASDYPPGAPPPPGETLYGGEITARVRAASAALA